MLISWEELDALQTADEIAACLRAAGIKGRRKVCDDCPLARATDSDVYTRDAADADGDYHGLTLAERLFVRRFDDGQYPDLIDAEQT